MSEELIRRSDAIKAIHDSCFLDEIEEAIYELPTIEPKRGEWIDYSCGSGCYCSNCDWDSDDKISEYIIKKFDFCPNCGARMKGADDE